MPVIQFPGYTKDPFGGPAGGTQQMFAAMLSSYMKTQEEMKKREQEKLLAELVSGGGRPDQPPGADPTGPAMNMPMPQGGYEMGPQDYPAVARSILSNPALDLKHKIAGVGAVTSMKELEPDPVKTKYITINWRDKNGVAQAPYVVPEDQANKVYAQLSEAGATFEKPDKPSTPSDGITQIEIYQQQYEEGSPQWNSLEKRKAEMRAMEAAKLAREKREGGKSGGEYTRAQLVDDTFKFYSSKLIGLTDELTKRPLKGMEEEYKKVMTQMQRDQALIEAGKKPAWLTEEGAIPPPEPPKPLTDEVRDTFIQEVIKENPRLSREDAIKEAMLKAKRAGY